MGLGMGMGGEGSEGFVGEGVEAEGADGGAEDDRGFGVDGEAEEFGGGRGGEVGEEERDGDGRGAEPGAGAARAGAGEGDVEGVLGGVKVKAGVGTKGMEKEGTVSGEVFEGHVRLLVRRGGDGTSGDGQPNWRKDTQEERKEAVDWVEGFRLGRGPTGWR